MRVAIRTDASLDIGTGHVMRCLTLAQELKEKGAEVVFVCRAHSGHMMQVISQYGFSVELLPLTDVRYVKSDNDVSLLHEEWLGVSWERDAEETNNFLVQSGSYDWLVVDHYAIDDRWEKKQKEAADKILVIDDLADRAHDCKILLDQNLYKGMGRRYANLVPMACKQLIGPEYSLLRHEFKEARKCVEIRKNGVGRILVFFGGTDPTGETMKVLRALDEMELPNIKIDVVVGGSNKNKKHISDWCLVKSNANYYCQITNISELMAKADLSLGAGGVATWERCAMLLPTIVVAVAFNQVAIAEAANDAGLVSYLGLSKTVTATDWGTSISHFIEHNDELESISRTCGKYVDCGGVERVVNEMLD